MKLARFDAGHGPRVGIIVDDGIVDIAIASGRAWTMAEIIAGGIGALATLQTMDSSAHHRLKGVKLLRPVERAGKYLAIGLNYQAHREEARDKQISAPAQQMWFNKQTSCLAGPYDEIDPGVTKALDYEVELGVIIGKLAKAVSADRALDHVFGYFVANDVSARDWQLHSPTWTIGKSFDTHGPIGPWITTADEIPDPQALGLRCFVNREQRQSASTAQMIYPVAEQISYLSTAFTLEPGDLIATGTPEGIGAAMKPPQFLKPGDLVRCEIDRLGAIENCVKHP